MDLFAKAGEVKNHGVRVEARTQWNEQKRRHQIFLKITKIYPDGTCA